VGSLYFAGKIIEDIQEGQGGYKGALDKAGVSAEHIDEVYMGNVCQANVGQAPARQAALGAGIPNTVPCK